MGFSYFNPNPTGQKVGDCTVRAIAKATGKSWDDVYTGLCLQGLIMGDLPSANSVWSAYLRQQGFTRNVIPNTPSSASNSFCFAEPSAPSFWMGSFFMPADGSSVSPVK